MVERSLEDIIRNKGTDEKLEIINNLWESNSIKADDFKILEYLSEDGDEEIRARVAEVLVICNSLISERILINLLTDNAELVRVNACDSLSISNSMGVISLLKERILKDNSSLVRGYAALSIVDIAFNANYNVKDLVDFFKKALEKEKVDWVKIHYYKVLYIFGHKRYLNKLLNELNHRLYRNRSAVVSILSDLVSTENNVTIKSALVERLKKERTVAVGSKIEKALKDIDQKIKR